MVVVCPDCRAVHACAKDFARVIVIEEEAMAAQNVLLAVHATAIGSCVVASFSADGVSELVELPSSFRPILLVALGLSDDESVAPPRRPMEKLLSWEMYREG